MKNDSRINKYNYFSFRYVIAFLIKAVEVCLMLGIVIALCIYVPYFYILCYLTEIFCIIRIIASDDNPDYKIPWLLVVLVLPVIGFMLYFIFYSRTLNKKYIKRLNYLKNKSYKRDDAALFFNLKSVDIKAHNQAKMLTNISAAHLFTNTKQTYFPIGEEMYKMLLEDLQKAERFIYMEYFIIRDGEFWNSIFEILKEKAAAGVDIKIVYDDIGCMTSLPGNFPNILSHYNIKATPFSVLRGNADNEFNNRSHRKITVIDGKVGYTGGINISDEYINKIERCGHWKDTAIRLEGEAVWELTKLFLIDYGINTRTAPEINSDYYPKQPNIIDNGFVIPFGDAPAPVYKHRVGQALIQNMVNDSTKYFYITTPYMILDNTTCQSIENAALRGVDVRIILPHVPDNKIIFGMTRSFYPRLMDAGVKIYEYEPGFVHAKSFLSDDEYAMIGTINLDYRSLVHHFENGVWMYKCQAIKDIKKDIENTLDQCIEITPQMLKTNILQKFVRSVVRIIAPML